MFAYLRANQIGLVHALFWEAWACVLELKNAHALADKAFVEGIERGAEPLKRLRRAHQAFITRMARRALDQISGADASSLPPASASAASRDALSTLPARATVSALRPSTAASRAQHGIGGAAPTTARPNASFHVFDENGAADAAAPRTAELPGATGSHADPWAEAHAKENARRAEKWSDFRVPQSKTAAAALRGGAAGNEPHVPFTVFDESGIADTKPDTSRERHTDKGLEMLGYDPLLMFFDRTADGGGYEESQMEEHRAGVARYAYTSDDEDAQHDVDMDDDGDAMDQTMVVGGGLRSLGLAATAPIVEQQTQTKAALRPALQPVSESPLAILEDLPAPKPATAVMTATISSSSSSSSLAKKAAEDATVCTREALDEINAMFNDTLQVFEDNSKHSKQPTGARGALTTRKVTVGDVVTSWDAQHDDSGPLGGARDDNDGTDNSGSFLHRLRDFDNADDNAANDDDDDDDQLARGDNDDNGILLGDATQQTDNTFEIFREQTVDLQQKHAALAQVTPLVSLTARMRDKENALLQQQQLQQQQQQQQQQQREQQEPAKLNVVIGDNTTGFVVFEDDAPAAVDFAPTVKFAGDFGNDEDDDEEDDGQSLVNPALVGKLRKMSIGRPRAAKNYDDNEDEGEQQPKDDEEDDDDDDDDDGLLNPKLMKRLRNSIGVSLTHRHDSTSSLSASRSSSNSSNNQSRNGTSAIDRLIAMRKGGAENDTTAIVSQHTASVTQSSTSLSDSLDRSPPTLSHHTAAGLLAMDRRASHASSTSSSVGASARNQLSSPTVAIVQRVPKALAGGDSVAYAGASVRAWLDALESDMMLLTNVHQVDGAMPEPNAAAMLELESCSLKVQRELGRGARGVVSLAERVDDMTGAADASVESTFALKRWTGAEAHERASWSFALSNEVQRRLAPDMRRNFLCARALELYGDGALLLTEHLSQATLADAITAHVRRSKPIDEPLAMYYTIELLRFMAPLHRAGLLHMAVDAHHLLVRNDQCANWNNWAVADRELNGWDTKGLVLIDFSSGVDRQLYPAGTKFVGQVPGAESQCAAVRDGRAWTIEPDVHGVACIAHELAFGSKLAMRKLPNGRWTLADEIKRIYQAPLWSKLFDLLLNIDGSAPNAIDTLDRCRESLEQYLLEKPLKAKGIKTALCRQQIMLFEARK